jgi:hypothetical protein
MNHKIVKSICVGRANIMSKERVDAFLAQKEAEKAQLEAQLAQQRAIKDRIAFENEIINEWIKVEEVNNRVS